MSPRKAGGSGDGRKVYKEWTRMPWDANPDLGYECWRKTFGKGTVSVGIGDFLAVVFYYGAASDDSHSATRWNYGEPPLTEQETMDILDRTGARRSPGGSRGLARPAVSGCAAGTFSAREGNQTE